MNSYYVNDARKVVRQSLPFTIDCGAFDVELLIEAIQWCKQEFGPRMFVRRDDLFIKQDHARWDAWTMVGANTFFFEKERDAVHFKLAFGETRK